MESQHPLSPLQSVLIELNNLSVVNGRLGADIGVRALLAECPISESDRSDLEKKFRTVVLSLAGMIAVSLAGSALLVVSRWQNLPLLGVTSGFLGSCTAALRSALDRHANGIEDADGHQWPDPEKKKERFNLRMATWFWYRPILGAVMGFLVYLAAQAGMLKSAVSSPGLAFFALLGGLFAKSLLDLLLDKFKTLFGL